MEEEQMDMEDIRDKVVGVILDNPHGLTYAGHQNKVQGSTFFARVVGFDAFGIWFESSLNKVLTHVYFPWNSIRSLIYFPDHRHGESVPKEKCLGFGCRVKDITLTHKHSTKKKK